MGFPAQGVATRRSRGLVWRAALCGLLLGTNRPPAERLVPVTPLVPSLPPLAAALPARVTLGVRPESWQLVAPGDGIALRVHLVEELGSEGFAHGTAEIGGRQVPLAVRLPSRGHVGPEDLLHLAVPLGTAHLFDTATGRRIDP